MNIINTTKLDSTQITDIRSLIADCKKYEKLTLEYPFDDEECLNLLLYDNLKLISAVAFLQIDGKLFECIAFTNPSDRKKGYTSQLLDAGINILKEKSKHITINFICDDLCPAAKAYLKNINAKLLDTQLKMSAILDNIALKPDKDIKIKKGSDGTYAIYKVNQHIGSFNILSYNKDTIYFYNYIIEEQYRGHGLGTAAFPNVLLELKKQGYRLILLQVSQGNIPALKIYKTYGFEITESLYYYTKDY